MSLDEARKFVQQAESDPNLEPRVPPHCPAADPLDVRPLREGS